MLSSRTLTHRILGLLGLALLGLTVLVATLWWVLFHRPDWIGYLPDTKTRLIDRTVERIHRARLQVREDGEAYAQKWTPHTVDSTQPLPCDQASPNSTSVGL